MRSNTSGTSINQGQGVAHHPFQNPDTPEVVVTRGVLARRCAKFRSEESWKLSNEVYTEICCEMKFEEYVNVSSYFVVVKSWK